MAKCRAYSYSSTTDEPESEASGDSSGASSVLSLRCSSSPFEDGNSSSDSDKGRVEPYMYEPRGSDSEETADSSDDETQRERLTNTHW